MITRHVLRCVLFCAALCALFAALGPLIVPVRAASPQLWLPTPLDQEWQIIQGYYCGTHTGRMARALDLVNNEGPTYGAPVRAAADGVTFFWTSASGTLIIDHGGGYYTQYTHLMNPITTRPGMPVKQGDIIAQVGTVGTRGYPHLDFVFFRGEGPYASNRQSLEMHFADGYSFPDIGGCSQHYGSVVEARGPDVTPPEIMFDSPVAEGEWLCTNEQISFTVEDDRLVEGFSQQFNQEIDDLEPAFQADTGYAELTWVGEGMHTLHVRAWDVNGHQTDASFGPVGYDAGPPRFAQADPVPVVSYAAGTEKEVRWQPADDGAGSGVEGYKLYLGQDAYGTGDWFSPRPEVTLRGLEPGWYVLRAQAVDAACGASDWITVQELLVLEPDDPSAPTATPTPEAPALPEETEVVPGEPAETDEPAEKDVIPDAPVPPAATDVLPGNDEPAKTPADDAEATPTPTPEEPAQPENTAPPATPTPTREVPQGAPESSITPLPIDSVPMPGVPSPPTDNPE